jgi:hypothetical protein
MHVNGTRNPTCRTPATRHIEMKNGSFASAAIVANMQAECPTPLVARVPQVPLLLCVRWRTNDAVLTML